ncbi:MAG: DUF2141 domain-containing protein [Alphaproteobacteria bacterium]|nr:DUF2141 domain-containing protein [Alphaproteobacteria bacterium]
MLKSLAATFAAIWIAAGACHAEPDASLTVTVRKVSTRGGDLRLALYDRAHWDNDDAPPVKDEVVAAHAPETSVMFQGLKPGIYGLKMFQDVNRNARFDFTWLGLPDEKYGFSRDAPAMFGSPAFDRTKFTLLPGPNAIVIHLR